MSDRIYEYLNQRFEWDDAKARKNWADHKVLFTEAATVFFDPQVLVFEDVEHSLEEQRYVIIGHSQRDRRLFVVHVYRGERIRLISARDVTAGKGEPMKPSWEDEYEMLAEFDFSKLKRIPNPFQQKFEDLHLVALDEDVAQVFGDSSAVNEALRLLIQARQRSKQKVDLPKAS